MVIVCISLAACSTQRKAIPGTEAGTPGYPTAKVEAPKISELSNTYKDWTTFYAPFSIRISHPVSFSFSGRATMVKDKTVNMSLRVLGMEVGVIYIDADSAIVVDKFHKYYVSLPISSVTARTSITLSDIQSIMLGQAIYPGKGSLSKINDVESLFSSAEQGDNLILTPRRSPKGVTWYLTLDPGPVLRQIAVEPDGLKPFNATFRDIVSSMAGPVASEISITGTLGKKELNAEMEWTMNRAEWNTGREASKPSTKGYKRLEAADFIKAMSAK